MQKGRIRVAGSVGLGRARRRSATRGAADSVKLFASGFALSLPHADPADRFLAATAKVLKLTLVTADQRLLGLGEIASLANR